MNILDREFTPLNDIEMDKLRFHFTHDFSKLTISDAILILRLFLKTKCPTYDKQVEDLLLRRLHMIIDWTNHPDRLL